PLLHEVDQLFLVDGVALARLDHRGDRFAEAVVGYAHHDGIPHPGMQFQDLFDLFGKDLLPAGVDAHRPSAEQRQTAVGLDHGVVAGYGVPVAVDHHKCAVGLTGVLVVADWLVAAHGYPAYPTRPWHHLVVLLVDDAGVLGDAELGCLDRVGRRGHGLTHSH